MTETSSRYARKISGTTALQEALKEKQQHIEQLLAERDLERAEVAKATSHVGEIEQELALVRDGHDRVKNDSGLVEIMVLGPCPPSWGWGRGGSPLGDHLLNYVILLLLFPDMLPWKMVNRPLLFSCELGGLLFPLRYIPA